MTPPADLLASGRESPRWVPPRWAARAARAAAAVVLVGGAAVVALARDEQDGGAPPPASAVLAVADDTIAVSLGGVLVVPVVLSSPDAPLLVRSAELLAAPVRSAPLVTAPDVVPQGQTRRLAAIVDPDCTVLGPEVGGELVATLVVRIASSPTGREEELRLSLGDAPSVLRVLDGLCGSGTSPVPARVSAEDERREVGLEARIDLSRG